MTTPEDPVAALTGMMSDMTEEELREKVQQWRAERTSSQTFRASGNPAKTKETAEPTKLEGLDEY